MDRRLSFIRDNLNQASASLEKLIKETANEIHFRYLGHKIVITPFDMQIGNMRKSIEKWELTTPEDVHDDWYNHNSREWAENKNWLLELCKRHRVNVERERANTKARIFD